MPTFREFLQIAELGNLVRFYNDTESQEDLSSSLSFTQYSTEEVLVMKFVDGDVNALLRWWNLGSCFYFSCFVHWFKHSLYDPMRPLILDVPVLG